MTAILSWYLAIQALSVPALLLVAPACRHLPDRGYSLGKALGVLLTGLGLWTGAALGLLRNEPGGAILAASLVLLPSLPRLVRRRAPLPRFPTPMVVSVELLFAVAAGGWCAVRYLDPAVSHTEQPMDLMLLTAVMQAPAFPPEDPWLAGFPISYYYVGYWLMGTVAHLTGQPAAVAYNAGQAIWFGLLVTTCFGIGCNLTATAARASAAGPGAIAGGLLAALTVAVAGNLHLVAEWVAARSEGARSALFTDPWWWWRSSRVVHDRGPAGEPVELITEFPFFSYLLGDNHPHLLAMPFVAVVVSIAFALYVRAPQADDVPPAAGEAAARRDPLLAAGAATVAALVATNTWDVPAALLLLVFAARRYVVGVLLGVSLLAAPYFLTAQSQVRGLLLNVGQPTSLAEFAVMFGSLAPGVCLLLAAAWTHRPPGPRLIATCLGIGLASCLLWLGVVWVSPGGSVTRWLDGWPVLVIVTSTLATAAAILWSHTGDPVAGAPGLTFAVLVAALGLLVTLVPEVIYLHDQFGNRMNTVFKFYYQAWLFLGLAGAVGIAVAARAGARMRIAAGAAALILAAGFVYAPLALRSKLRLGEADAGTLDALAHLQRVRPDEHAAIAWVRTHTPRGAIVVQAPGDSYQSADNIISAATARPTLIGWQGHERQWRGEAYAAMTSGRLEALERIYRPSSVQALQQALADWHVSFVYVGPSERARYEVLPEHEARWIDAMDLVFESGPVRIFRRRG